MQPYVAGVGGGGGSATAPYLWGLQKRCWVRVSHTAGGAQVGQYIQSRGGVVAAEELAPFLDVTPEALAAAREGAFVDEAYVVPSLVRFSGQPEVGPDGELLYRFPSLQRTARAQVRRLWQAACTGQYTCLRVGCDMPCSCQGVNVVSVCVLVQALHEGGLGSASC